MTATLPNPSPSPMARMSKVLLGRPVDRSPAGAVVADLIDTGIRPDEVSRVMAVHLACGHGRNGEGTVVMGCGMPAPDVYDGASFSQAHAAEALRAWLLGLHQHLDPSGWKR